jgi:hypothetical protein
VRAALLVDREETDREVETRLLADARRRYDADELSTEAFAGEVEKALDPEHIERERHYLVNARPPLPEMC